MKIVLIDYGAGNIKSLQFAIERLGYKATLSNDKSEIENADKVIFPGVGHADSTMKMLQEKSLDKVIPTLQQPVLGICLGMQLLCTASEEGNIKGLGVFNVAVKRFSNGVKVPQMGWNTISNLKTDLFKDILENEFMYLVHSYYAPICDATIATTDYGGDYSSALQKGNFYGVQFHPEKSSKAGEKLLKNFLTI